MAWLATTLLLAGCASGGTLVTERQLSGFTRGQTTYAQVVAALGRPRLVTATPEGTRIAIYGHDSFRTRPTTFVPLVGSFTGGVDERNTDTYFFFDGQNVLTNWQTNSSSVVHRGFSTARTGAPPSREGFTPPVGNGAAPDHPRNGTAP